MSSLIGFLHCLPMVSMELVMSSWQNYDKKIGRMLDSYFLVTGLLTVAFLRGTTLFNLYNGLNQGVTALSRGVKS